MADDAINLSIADVEIVAAEPRIHDLKLAEALGFVRTRDIRKLIERHRAALERFGKVCAMVAQTSDVGGRPANEYWLNKRQAIYIATQAKTPRATDITIMVVEVFDRATTDEPRVDGPPYFPSCDAPPPPGYAAQRPLPPPPEPPICAGCAAKALISPGMDPAHHPLADGPLTASELAFIVLLRGEMKKRETAMRRDISNELIRRLAAGIADGGGQ